MQNDLELLREENERLKILVNALTDKLMFIKNPVYSYVESNVGVTNLINPMLEKKVGVTNLINPMLEKKVGVTNLINPMLEKKVGVTNLINPILEKNVGVTDLISPMLENNIVQKQFTWRDAVKGVRREMVTSSISGVTNAAKILVQLQVQPRNSYKVLKKLTGLSEDGLTKHIMSLKKRGLIVRTAFQQYTLTAKALKILHEAV